MADQHNFSLVSEHSALLSNLETRVAAMERTIDSLTDQLKTMTSLLNKVKNWIVGGVAVALAQQFGILEVVKMALKGIGGP